jgi:hypothetical protein
MTDQLTTDPATTDPATTDPATTDPATTDPATTDPATTDPASATTARFRRAGEAGDIDRLLETLAPDAVLRSPITDRLEFRGHDEIRAVMESVFATIDNIRYSADVGHNRTRVLFGRATVNGQPVEEAIRIELDEHERITEMTLFYRPLPGLATLTAALAPRVARKHGPMRSLLARILLAPLAAVIRLGDRLVPWFG